MMIEQEIKNMICDRYKTVKEFARVAGIPYTTLDSMLKRGVTKTNLPNIIRLCQVLNLDVDAIAAGRIEAKKFSPHTVAAPVFSDDALKLARDYDKLGFWGQKALRLLADNELARIVEQQAPQNEPIPGKMIPFNRSIQPASAGTGAYLGPEEFETIFVQENPLTSRAAFGVPVSGDSMEPAYHNGDVLIVEKAEDIAPGEIGVFSIDNEGYVKQRGDNELISLNPDYGPIPMNNSIWCHGRVIGVLDPSWIME